MWLWDIDCDYDGLDYNTYTIYVSMKPQLVSQYSSTKPLG